MISFACFMCLSLNLKGIFGLLQEIEVVRPSTFSPLKKSSLTCMKSLDEQRVHLIAGLKL